MEWNLICIECKPLFSNALTNLTVVFLRICLSFNKTQILDDTPDINSL